MNKTAGKTTGTAEAAPADGGSAADGGPPTGAAERRREQRGWYFYDFACSVYSTSVLTVFLVPI